MENMVRNRYGGGSGAIVVRDWITVNPNEDWNEEMIWNDVVEVRISANPPSCMHGTGVFTRESRQM